MHLANVATGSAHLRQRQNRLDRRKGPRGDLPSLRARLPSLARLPQVLSYPFITNPFEIAALHGVQGKHPVRCGV